MKINSLNELYNYIKSKNELTSNGNLMQLCACVDQYKNICSCKQKEKGQKLFECNNQYINTINNLDQPTIDLLLLISDDKTIDFYENSKYIRTISISS
jgi:hypothetical protein